MSSGNNLVYFMTGRFQPFTLGHLKLFNEMIIRASERSPDADAYLFVSYKNPKFSIKNVATSLKHVVLNIICVCLFVFSLTNLSFRQV